MNPCFEKPPYFVFDLDSTVTRAELLPLLAREAGIEELMRFRTERAMNGEIPFDQDFKERVALLQGLSISRAREIAAQVPVNPMIARFLQENPQRCTILTGNLDLWVEPLMKRLHMEKRFISSRARMRGGKIDGVDFVLDKGAAARALPHPFVAIGDGGNDVAMLQEADWGIAFGGVREPAACLLDVADCRIDDEVQLCAWLKSYI